MASSGGPCTENVSIPAAMGTYQNVGITTPVYAVSPSLTFDWTSYFLSHSPLGSTYTEAVASQLVSSPAAQKNEEQSQSFDSSSDDTRGSQIHKETCCRSIKNCKVEIRKSFSDPDLSYSDRQEAASHSPSQRHKSRSLGEDWEEQDSQRSSNYDRSAFSRKFHSESDTKLSRLCENEETDLDSDEARDRLSLAASNATALVITCNKNKKKVQFADELGKTLATIKVLYDGSDTPPKLGHEAFKDLDQRSTSAATSSQQQDPEKFFCSFNQPTSQYILFREMVEKNCISLNSVYFQGCCAKGTITVKNIHFEKLVYVRLTLDSWISHIDVPAVWSCSDQRTDTFSFSFEIPDEQESAVEFCVYVNYVQLQQQNWDNNKGQNYVLLPVHRKPQPYNNQFKPNFTNVKHFADFSVWEHFDDKIYY